MVEPLRHVTVIDTTRFLAGPFCTQLLGDLGAEVIKVEPPGGSPNRGTTPEQNGMGSTFISRNRNKKSIVVNLKTDEGRELMEALVAEADVLVENFSLGVMERLGLGYDYLSTEVNPGLVYASIKAFGESGPAKDRKGVDPMMQAEAGLMSVTGEEDGDPVKVGVSIGDMGAGLYSAIAILTALNYRDQTGEGQKVETDLFGTVTSFMEEHVTAYSISGENPRPVGTKQANAVPSELFETADGHIMVNASIPTLWERLVADVLEEDHLLQYDSSEKRQDHYDDIMAVLRPRLREQTTVEWQAVLDEHGIPNGALSQVSDVVAHPHARERGDVFDYTDDTVGEVTMAGYPLHFSKSQTSVRSGPPALGEHTDEVLADLLGLDADTIAGFHDDGIVG
ncbi:CaiB/BaiF CoA transferase family protein [Halorarius litoreus]|uniref:CaiB/BaiF CoA transferase family protein n=1 Tax=Halorarius litoreus TaxID=2962676 RepID=UPI0020CF76BA|nr:CoA transferase [Halorarius litoreus]